MKYLLDTFAGAMKSTEPQKTLQNQRAFVDRFVSLPFDDTAAMVYASIRAKLEMSGKPIGPNDMLIAAIVVANDLILVTNNTSEFSRIEGLKLEDWSTTV